MKSDRRDRLCNKNIASKRQFYSFVCVNTSVLILQQRSPRVISNREPQHFSGRQTVRAVNTSTKPITGASKDVSTASYGPIGEQLSRAEMSARTTQRLLVLGEMTENIAHDFRNILTVVDSGLRLAERSYDAPERVRACIAGAREGIVRGLALTSQLLTFAKQRELDARVCDANALLRDLELFLKYGAGSTIRVVTQLSPDIPNCLIDPSQFAAAILNLVLNARDAMPSGGTVHISTVGWQEKTSSSQFIAPGHYVRIRVSDDGLGMSPEVIERISEPFFTTKGEKGTGLGIPQVYAFMRHLGGHVCIASNPGRGTTVDLFFRAMNSDCHPADVDSLSAPPSRDNLPVELATSEFGSSAHRMASTPLRI
jgi:signal transduction histidine kinase